jgi:hypothetical protein
MTKKNGLLSLIAVVCLSACGGGSGGGQDIGWPGDAQPGQEVAEGLSDPPPGQEVEPAAEATGEPSLETLAEAATEAEVNHAPGFNALPPVTVEMGHTLSLDLNGYIDDQEDADPALALSWSTRHVALADDGSHVLTVVGPVDWFGDEQVELTVSDTVGATARAFLTVHVTEVKPPEPPLECPKTLFQYDAGAATPGQVLLSGTFNQWAGVGASQLALTDPDGDHLWELEMALPGGHYLYKFIVDGTWVHDPANPNQVDDGFGGKNSVLDVAECEVGL